jgi:hypothetical protein
MSDFVLGAGLAIVVMFHWPFEVEDTPVVVKMQEYCEAKGSTLREWTLLGDFKCKGDTKELSYEDIKK